MEYLQFIFLGFWHFAGVVVLLAVGLNGLAAIVAAARK
jgi:hypothetical protein